MKCSAGVWIGYLPKEMEGRKVLDVEFVPPEDINMEIWKPSFPLAYYTPDNLLFKGETMESIIKDFHLARMQVEIESTDINKLLECAQDEVYPHIQKACVIVDMTTRTGHIFISPEIIIRSANGTFGTWIGVTPGKPQGEVKKDLLKLMEDVFTTCKDTEFIERIERALVKWGKAQEEPEDSLKIAELWSALDALLKKKGELDKRTITRRSIVLAVSTTRESIELFRAAGLYISFDPSNLKIELKNFLYEAYEVRLDVYHDAKEPKKRPGFSLDLSSLTQVSILMMAEFAQSGYTWKDTVAEIDQRAKQSGITGQ